MEIPVLVPKEGGKYVYAHAHYMAVFPRNLQDSYYGKEIKVSGMFQEMTNTIMVQEVDRLENGGWKKVWNMPKGMMQGM